MPVGFEFYDLAGNTVTGPDDYVFKFVGTIAVNSGVNPSGSILDATLAGGGDFDFWFMSTNGGGTGPEVTVTSSGVSWTNPWPHPSYGWIGVIYYGYW